MQQTIYYIYNIYNIQILRHLDDSSATKER